MAEEIPCSPDQQPIIRGSASPLRASLDWPAISEEATRLANKWRRACHFRDHSAEDLAQEAMLRLYVYWDRGGSVLSTSAWLDVVLRRIVADAYRREHMTIGSRPEGLCWSFTADSAPEPEGRAVLSETWDTAERFVENMAPPYRQIAELQYFRTCTRKQIIRYLQVWRPISQDEARRLIARTHFLLARLGRSLATGAWQGASSTASRKNPWSATPPPPVLTDSLAGGSPLRGLAMPPRRNPTPRSPRHESARLHLRSVPGLPPVASCRKPAPRKSGQLGVSRRHGRLEPNDRNHDDRVRDLTSK